MFFGLRCPELMRPSGRSRTSAETFTWHYTGGGGGAVYLGSLCDVRFMLSARLGRVSAEGGREERESGRGKANQSACALRGNQERAD